MSRPGLIHRLLWLAIGWGLVALVVALSLVPSPPQSGFDQGDKVGHLLAYATLMGWFGQLYPPGWRLALAFVALGLVLEILQGLSGYRQASMADMLANTLGVVLGGWATRRWPHVLSRMESFR